ncbi:MAG: hypothetical protein JOZ69_24130 [Myxococcales bacterium]|nr:hypothetical protein [Myxococcales bacterium]
MPAGLTLRRSAEQMQNWRRQAPAAEATGFLPSLHHPVTRPFPTVSAYDVGREAAELLDGPLPDRRQARLVHLEGPRRYSAEDFAGVFEAALGRPVCARALPRASWADALARAALGPSYARLIVELQEAHNAGRVDVETGAGEVRRARTELGAALGPALARA